jgi:hypothetical protein
MLDPLLRRNFVYEVADSFGSTKTKIENLLNEHNSGKMEEGGVFTYRLNLMINPGFFNSNQVVYGKGWLEANGKSTVIHFTTAPNVGIVFLILILFPLFGLNAFFGDKSLMNIPGFLFSEGFMISFTSICAFLLRRGFEKRFDLR